MKAVGCLLWGVADFVLLFVLLGALLICVAAPCMTLLVAGSGGSGQDARSVGEATGALFSSSLIILAAVIAICARVFARRSIVQRALRR